MIYDCFMFYNELDLLEIRIEELWDVVDYFVLSEAVRSVAPKIMRAAANNVNPVIMRR